MLPKFQTFKPSTGSNNVDRDLVKIQSNITSAFGGVISNPFIQGAWGSPVTPNTQPVNANIITFASGQKDVLVYHNLGRSPFGFLIGYLASNPASSCSIYKSSNLSSNPSQSINMVSSQACTCLIWFF